MHAFNVLLQSSLRVALEKEHDRNKAAIGVFNFFFLSIKMLMEPEYYRRKFYLKYIHQDHHAISGMKSELIKNTSVAQTVGVFCFV